MELIIETYEYAVKNRDNILSSVDAVRQKELMKLANEMWINYVPKKVNANIAGIDSSWNAIGYHGFYLYAVDAVSVLADGSYAAPPKFEVGIGSMFISDEFIYNPSLWLESKGMKYEHDLSIESSGFTVLIDGSVLARFYDSRTRKISTFLEYASDLMKMSNIIFVAKSSTSNAALHGAVGDLYYFSKAGNSAGFSKPFKDQKGVLVTYVRLADYTPVLRLEVTHDLNEREIMDIMDIVGSVSYDGYPYVLRLAHERCKISNSDMALIEGALGLSAEQSSREVLGE